MGLVSTQKTVCTSRTVLRQWGHDVQEEFTEDTTQSNLRNISAGQVRTFVGLLRDVTCEVVDAPRCLYKRNSLTHRISRENPGGGQGSCRRPENQKAGESRNLEDL